jgi:DNA topoisomerase-1
MPRGTTISRLVWLKLKTAESKMAHQEPQMPQASQRSARDAGLRYVNVSETGLKRSKFGTQFRYISANNRAIGDQKVIARIQKLAIPPAWDQVWICRDSRGHIQATGRDARGRKQYIYHPKWSETRDENKFHRMLEFGRALPKIRSHVNRHLRRPNLDRPKVLAAVIRLLDLGAMRVGNEEYVHQNNSYGLTTLRNRHAKVNGDCVHLRFRGKGGKEQAMSIEHPAIAKIIRKCQHVPGQFLFEYFADDGIHHITSADVNGFLFEISAQNFTAKDFRTWKATVLAATTLSQLMGRKTTIRAGTKIVMATVKRVADHLGNTPAICKKSYIHPAVFQCFSDGTLGRFLTGNQNTKREQRVGENAVLQMLRAIQRKQRGNWAGPDDNEIFNS